MRSPREIVFGAGARVSLPDAVASRGMRCLLVSDENVVKMSEVTATIDAIRAAGIELRVFDLTQPDLPVSCLEECMLLGSEHTDVVLAIGGGSCIDLGKLAALLLRYEGPIERYYGEQLVAGPTLPLIAVPTTAGTGSEVTPVAVVSDDRRVMKVGISSEHLIPDLAVCDPELTLSCPPGVSASSGVDALVHAVEARTAARQPRVWEQHGKVIFEGANTHSDLFAEEAIRRISGSLGDVLKMPSDLCARTAMLYGSLCAGLAFAQAGTAGAHALQYPVGALTKTAHGIGVGLLAPHVFAYTRSSAVEAFAAVGAALGVGDSDQTIASLRAVAELYRLITAAGIPPSLQAIGLPETALDQTAAEAALIKRLTRNSPRALDRAALRAILESALHGNPEQLDVELGPFLDQPEAPFGVSASAAPPSTGTVG